MSLVDVEESVRVHPLFQEVDGYSFIGRISDDSLHMLVDFSQSERISAVEKAIRRRMDPEKDMELLNWFRLLKRVYALDIIGDSQMDVLHAERVLKQEFGSGDLGIHYRKHLKLLYTELPDSKKEEGKYIVPVYALPETKAWILAEIADGWNSSGHLDSMDCLMFLSAATDTLSLSGNRYLAFYRMRSWDEVRKCVRNLLRERSKDFSEKEIAEFLKLPVFSGTVAAVLWHTLIAKTIEYEGTRAKLRIMLESVSW